MGVLPKTSPAPIISPHLTVVPAGTAVSSSPQETVPVEESVPFVPEQESPEVAGEEPIDDAGGPFDPQPGDQDDDFQDVDDDVESCLVESLASWRHGRRYMETWKRRLLR